VGFSEDIEKDVMDFYNEMDDMSRLEKIQKLRSLLEKYSRKSSSDHIMNISDLNDIVGYAKSIYAQKTFPAFLGYEKKKIEQHKQANLCVIESTIRYLNQKDCLKKMPKFDYREDKF
jgi:hypothetical protein